MLLINTNHKSMAHYYTENFSKETSLKPKKETIDFLLNYSKALSVINYKKLQFESINN